MNLRELKVPIFFFVKFFHKSRSEGKGVPGLSFDYATWLPNFL